MKKLKILLSILAFSLCISILPSCGNTTADTSYPLKNEELLNLERGQSVDVDQNILKITQNFTPKSKRKGYISNVKLTADISGYESSFTYFDAIVKITWIYNEISDANRTGIDQSYSIVINLDPDGEGKFSDKLSLKKCRDIKLISVEYEFDGMAVKK